MAVWLLALFGKKLCISTEIQYFMHFAIVNVLYGRYCKTHAHRVVGILEVGILGQKWNHDILFLIQFLVPKGIRLRFWQWKIIKNQLCCFNLRPEAMKKAN